MCYYDQTIFSCGDWKWGHFRKHCQKEYRMGETCGMRLCYNTFQDSSTKCSVCTSLDKKNRRYAKAKADYDRWIGQADRQASAAKAVEELQVLYKEIEELNAQREARYTNVGSNRPRGSKK